MYFQAKLYSITNYMRENKIDAWVVFDHRDKDPVGKFFLGNLRPLTRQYVLVIPQDGRPFVVASAIESTGLRRSEFVAKVFEYNTLEEFRIILSDNLSAFGKIAVDYSVFNPEIDLIPAGRKELLTEILKETRFVSAGDLIQLVQAVLSEEEIRDHRRAARKCHEIMLEAFNYIKEYMNSGLSELDVSNFILGRFKEEGLNTTEEIAPIIASGKNSSNPHHVSSDQVIEDKKVILIDFSAKYSIYADITWVGFTGVNIPNEVKKAFEVVIEARNLAINAIKPNIEAWKIDKVTRDHIASKGYGKFFIHRTGHSLDFDVHGKGANLDNYEIKENRKLLPRSIVTVEPGIYLNEFGVRTEVDVLITHRSKEVTTPIQDSIVLLR